MTTAGMGPSAEAVGDDRGRLRGPGGWLTGASLVWFALLPVSAIGGTEVANKLFEYETEREGLVAVGQHTTVWVAMNLALALGAVLGTIGLIVLARVLRASARSRAVDVGVGIAVVGTTAWVIEVLGRLTIVVARGRDALIDPTIGGDGSYLGFSAVLFLIAYLAWAAPPVFGWVLARRRLPGRVGGLVVAVLTTLGAVGGMVTAVPLMTYAVGVLPMGLILFFASRRRRVG